MFIGNQTRVDILADMFGVSPLVVCLAVFLIVAIGLLDLWLRRPGKGRR